MQGRQTNSNIYYIKGLAQEALKSGITIDEVNEVFNRKNEAIKNIVASYQSFCLNKRDDIELFTL